MKAKAVKVSYETWKRISKLKIDWGLRRKETVIDALIYFADRKGIWPNVQAYCEEAEK